MKLSGKGLVIQLTRDYIRIAKAELGAKARILDCARLDAPSGAVEDGAILDVEALCGVLKPALSAPEFCDTKRAVFVLGTTRAIFERVTVPAVSGKRLDKMIAANMDMYFPVTVSDYRISRQEACRGVDENGRKTLFLQLWAIPSALLEGYYKLAAACGLSVAAIDYCGNSMVSAAGVSYGKKAEHAADGLYIMAEPEQFLMTFVKEGQVRMQRSLLVSHDTDSALNEAMMVLEYYRSVENERDNGLTAFLSGGLAGEKGFAERVSAALNIPATVLENGHGPEWCACLGAAKTALDFGGTEKSTGSVWHYALLLAGLTAMLAAVLFMQSVNSWARELADLQENEADIRERAVESRRAAEEYSAYAASYQSFSDDWDMVLNSLQTYNDNLPLVLAELEALLPSRSRVERMDIRADGLTLELSCTDKEEAAYLIMALREMEYAAPAHISDLSEVETREEQPVKAETTVSKPTLAQRKAALRALLEDEPGAAGSFYELLKEDAYRESGSVLYETIAAEVWKSQYLLSAILSGGDEQRGKALPKLVDIITENAESVGAAEELIRSDSKLWQAYERLLAAKTETKHTEAAAVTVSRVAFSVELRYSEALMAAEVEREGFDPGEMPVMLEVEE